MRKGKRYGARHGKHKAFSIAHNATKAWSDGKTNGWMAALHVTEAISQLGVDLFGGEELEVLYNLGATAVDSGLEYYEHTHKKV